MLFLPLLEDFFLLLRERKPEFLAGTEVIGATSPIFRLRRLSKVAERVVSLLSVRVELLWIPPGHECPNLTVWGKDVAGV